MFDPLVDGKDRDIPRPRQPAVKPPYTLEFYADDEGREPVAVSIDNLEPHKRAALLAALQEILARHGKDVLHPRVREEPRQEPVRVPPTAHLRRDSGATP